MLTLVLPPSVRFYAFFLPPPPFFFPPFRNLTQKQCKWYKEVLLLLLLKEDPAMQENQNNEYAACPAMPWPLSPHTFFCVPFSPRYSRKARQFFLSHHLVSFFPQSITSSIMSSYPMASAKYSGNTLITHISRSSPSQEPVRA